MLNGAQLKDLKEKAHASIPEKKTNHVKKIASQLN